MTTKKAPRKRKESMDVTEDFKHSFKKNFDCASIQMKKMFPLTDNQTAFYYLTQNEKTNMVFLQGPSGTGKSYIAIYSALELLKERKVDKIIYIRTAVESASKSIGYLKGDLADKFSEYSVILNSKLLESTDSQTVQSLFDQEYVKSMPVNFARGLTFNNCAVIFDEVQSASRAEITTIITRFGRGSKFFLLGDVKQSDINNSGFETVHDLFDTEFSRKNHIHCMKFDTSDIIRSNILKHITQVLGV